MKVTETAHINPYSPETKTVKTLSNARIHQKKSNHALKKIDKVIISLSIKVFQMNSLILWFAKLPHSLMNWSAFNSDNLLQLKHLRLMEFFTQPTLVLLLNGELYQVKDNVGSRIHP